MFLRLTDTGTSSGGKAETFSNSPFRYVIEHAQAMYVDHLTPSMTIKSVHVPVRSVGLLLLSMMTSGGVLKMARLDKISKVRR